jgi:hypothetical protein
VSERASYSISAILRGEAAARAFGPRRALLVASTSLLVGIGMVGLRPSDPSDTTLIDLGMVVTLLSLLLLIGGIHTYGRLGLDEGEKPGQAE